MDEHWTEIIEQCRTLSEKSKVALPNIFEKAPGGRVGADPWLKEATMLQHLAGFLEEVNKKQAGAGFISGPAKGRKAKEDATDYAGSATDGG